MLKVPLNHAILLQETGLNCEERSVCLITLKKLVGDKQDKEIELPIYKKGKANQCA